MKTRIGFVSNSSSASFMVPKSRLTYNEGVILLRFGTVEENDGWLIYEDGDCIRGSTIMDNEALDEYLKKHCFDTNKLEWGY